MNLPATTSAPSRRRQGGWRFLFRSDSIALNLVATVAGNKQRDLATDRFSEPALLARWFCEANLPPLEHALVVADVQRTMALREAIFRLAQSRLLGGAPAAADIALINDHARAGVPVQRIAADGRSTEPPSPARLDELLGLIARDAIEVLTGPYRDRIKQCESARCHVMFVDRSRNGARRWCAMSPCGDQASARAYRERRKVSLTGLDEGDPCADEAHVAD